MDLIDREEALSLLIQNGIDENYTLYTIISNLPTIKARKIVEAEWLDTQNDNKKRCSNCDVIHLIAQYPFGNTNFCPNCGATMNIIK